MVTSLWDFSCIALLAMHRNPIFSLFLHVLKGLTARLVGRVSIPAKHAAITIARTAQNLADFGIVNMLSSSLEALRDSAAVTENILCPPLRNQCRDSDRINCM